MKPSAKQVIAVIAVSVPLSILSSVLVGPTLGQARHYARTASTEATTRIPVTFSDGYETDPRDMGRPVVLVAAALNVPTDVFRTAFSGVHPAPAGQQPQPGEVHQNKDALLHVLAPYGVTNDRLDEVSNYYRYNRSNGEIWRNSAASAYATVKHGVVTGFVVTDPGAGYSSPPSVSVPGMPNVTAVAKVSYTTDLSTNGSIGQITFVTR